MDLDHIRDGWREAARKIQERLVDVTIRYTAGDQEYVEHVQLAAEDICKMFKVPLEAIDCEPNLTRVEQLSIDHLNRIKR